MDTTKRGVRGGERRPKERAELWISLLFPKKTSGIS